MLIGHRNRKNRIQTSFKVQNAAKSSIRMLPSDALSRPSPSSQPSLTFLHGLRAVAENSPKRQNDLSDEARMVRASFRNERNIARRWVIFDPSLYIAMPHFNLYIVMPHINIFTGHSYVQTKTLKSCIQRETIEQASGNRTCLDKTRIVELARTSHTCRYAVTRGTFQQVTHEPRFGALCIVCRVIPAKRAAADFVRPRGSKILSFCSWGRSNCNMRYQEA